MPPPSYEKSTRALSVRAALSLNHAASSVALHSPTPLLEPGIPHEDCALSEPPSSESVSNTPSPLLVTCERCASSRIW